MMRALAILICLFSLIVSVQAQDTNHQLKVLSVEEYITSIAAITDQFTDRYTDIILAMLTEFHIRYGTIDLQTIDFDDLHTFQTAIGIGDYLLLPIDEYQWFTALLSTALAERTSLEIAGEITAGEFEIQVIPIDFDGDQQEDFLLEVYDRFSWRKFYALWDGDIQILPIPITGASGDVVTRRLPMTGAMGIVRNEDLDGDGSDELIIEGGGYGYWSDCGDLYVLDWQAGAVITVGSNLFHYCIPMQNEPLNTVSIHTDLPDELRMIIRMVDGWGCETIRTDTLVFASMTPQSRTEAADSVWCQMRDAATAFEDQQYQIAIDTYTQILPGLEEQLAQYVLARLVLAHTLAGQFDQADNLLHDVEQSGQMGELLAALEAASGQPENMCKAAHDFFAAHNPRTDPSANPYEWTPANFYFGTNAIDPRYYPLPIPSVAGCDLQIFANSQPTPLAIPTISIGAFLSYRISNQLLNKEYADTLSQIDEFLTSAEIEAQHYVLPLFYWRAVTLEQMGRNQEALEQYLAIVNRDPESWWGKMAAIHIDTDGE
jgi:tetratricopeptide (TPR) repeat protein